MTSNHTLTVCLLGGGGFIGSHLARFLDATSDHHVIAVDTSAEKLGDLTKTNIEFHQLDITDARAEVEALVERSDVVLDLVAYANPSLYVSSPLEVFNLNFRSNLRVIDLCVKHETRLIQFSTAEVYGKPSDDAYHEDHSDLVMGPVGRQRWIYAASKQLLERVIHAYGIRGELDYTIVRPFNFIGPRIDYLVPPGAKGGPRVFAHFMSALMSGGPMYLVDGGEARRTFTHIMDGNRALLTLLEHPDARGEIFNVGNPDADVSIRELAHLMCELYEELTGQPSRSPIVNVPAEEFYGEGYEDSTRVPPDVSKLRALGWRPRHDLTTTFRETMAHYLGAGEATSITVDLRSSVNGERHHRAESLARVRRP